MEPAPITAEIASEHHDRITEAEHEAELAAEEAKRAEEQATDVMAQLAGKSDIGHKHDEDYIRRDEADELIGGLVRQAQDAARDAEAAATDAEAAAATDSHGGEGAGAEASELPLPEPEPEPIQYERRHGRYHQRRSA